MPGFFEQFSMSKFASQEDREAAIAAEFDRLQDLVAKLNAQLIAMTNERDMRRLAEKRNGELLQQRNELLAALEQALPMVPCGSMTGAKVAELAAGGHRTAEMILRHRAMIDRVKGSAA